MEESIKKVMKRVFKVSEIPDDVRQKDFAEWDSLRHLNLIVELEKEFDVSFEPEEIARMKDIPSIVKFLKKQKTDF